MDYQLYPEAGRNEKTQVSWGSGIESLLRRVCLEFESGARSEIRYRGCSQSAALEVELRLKLRPKEIAKRRLCTRDIMHEPSDTSGPVSEVVLQVVYLRCPSRRGEAT